MLGSHAITNGAYSLQVKIARGSVEPDGYQFLDVQDPAEMKGGLDQESLPNFLAVARGAAERSGLTLADLDSSVSSTRSARCSRRCCVELEMTRSRPSTSTTPGI